MKIIKLRTGDLVYEKSDKRKDIGIVGITNTKHWSLIKGHVDVYFRTNADICVGSPRCCDIKDLVLFKKRELVEDYWNYIVRK